MKETVIIVRKGGRHVAQKVFGKPPKKRENEIHVRQERHESTEDFRERVRRVARMEGIREIENLD